MSTARTVLVTGGNRGIGYAIAQRMIAEGHRVAVTSRSGDGPEGSLTVRAEMNDSASIDAAFTEVEAQLGAVEVVVANAGITRDTLLLRMSEEDFTEVIDTNLTEALVSEGFVREVISKIQNMRKDAGFEVVDRIRVTYTASPRLSAVIEAGAQEIMSAVLAVSLTPGAAGEAVREWNINGEVATLGVGR